MNNLRNTIHGLLITPNSSDGSTIQKIAGNGGSFQVTLESVSELKEGVRRLQGGNWDVVLLDWVLPGIRPLEVFSNIRQSAPRTPIIILIDSSQEALAIEAMQQGAQDYLLKSPMDQHAWARAVRYAVENRCLDRQLQQLQSESEQFLSSLTSILIGVNVSGLITHWNRVAAATFGVATAEAIHRPLTACRIVWDIQTVLAGLVECQKYGRVTRLDNIRFRRSNGEDGVVAFTINAIGESQNGYWDCLMLGADITERRKLEIDVKQKTNELERSNTELVRREQDMRRLLDELRLSKTRLEEQQKSLQEANRRLLQLGVLKDEFVATVSHELRTPLTAIEHGISLMLDGILGSLNDEQQEFLKGVEQSIDRLTELITNLLDLSRIEAGRMHLSRRKLRLQEVVDSTLESYRMMIGTRRIVRDYTPTPAVFADAHRMMQIFGNLLSNSVKFTRDDGTITFHISHEAEQIKASVEDDGTGIAPEDLSKLFQKFSQVGQQNNRRIQGTGLGLAVCKELVELHHGNISVVSDLGRGSTFTVSLPVYTDEFALIESFKELLDVGPSDNNRSIGLIAIQLGSFTDGSLMEDDQRHAAYDRWVEEVRRRLHRGDLLIVMKHDWIVVLASVDAKGLKAIIQRLREAFRGESVQLGAALYPIHGIHAVALFDYARKHLSGEPVLDGSSG